jgi:protein-S-isoprenylcysteine O-methyltransferase Ste14
MIAPLSVTSGLWDLWLLGWLVAAGWSAKTVARQSLSARLAHITLLFAGALLLFRRPNTFAWPKGPLLAIPPWVSWVAVGFVLAGLAFAWWARLHLGRNWSGNVTLKAEHELVRSGLYRITRESDLHRPPALSTGCRSKRWTGSGSYTTVP